GRQGRAPPDRHHQLDDPEGTPQPDVARRLAPSAYRRRGRRPGPGRQPPHEAIHGNAEDDEELLGREAQTHDAGLQGWRAPGFSRHEVAVTKPGAYAGGFGRPAGTLNP